MLSVDVSSFMNNWFSGFLELLVGFIQLLDNVVVFNISNTPITGLDFFVGGLIVSLVFGLFLFVAPLMKGRV